MSIKSDAVPIYLATEENMRLLKMLEELKSELVQTQSDLMAAQKENEQLKQILNVRQQDVEGGLKMGYHVNNVKQAYSKPALKEHASIDAIVKIIHEEGITCLTQVGAKLGVSYATVLRRLQKYKLHPVEKKAIQDYYDLFCLSYEE